MTVKPTNEIEREEPLNEALEAFESIARLLVATGYEAQMRARFAKFLPAPIDEPVELQTVDLLETRMLIDACKSAERSVTAAGAQNALRRVAAKARADLDAAMKARKAAV
ncbi:hypothetical protein [Hyphomicrobium sp. 802]|uniref:hypothetical protein n=1 Tax=Hyphomicrobium sp. 802 TaxID=1112272 RepID=UPI00045EAD9F|nr:hypothetical protein [Hyphomicrobium sp. 802]